MNKRKGNIVAIALLALVISIAGCITAFAESSSTVGGNLTETLTWSISDNVLTISGTGAMPDYNSPWENYSFSSVMIEEGVTSIGNDSFYQCNSITDITIPSSVKEIGSNAFWRCNKIKYFWIPENVDTIGRSAFGGYDSNSAVFCEASEKPQGWNEHWTNLEAYYSFDNEEYQYWNTLNTEETSIIVPNGFTVIPTNAFYGCEKLSKVKIPSSVMSIGRSAFSGCTNLTSIIIPDGISRIEDEVFKNCKNLTRVDMPNTVTSIGASAFEYCKGLTEITIPDNVTSIGDCAFHCCKGLTKVVFPDGLTSIGNNAFYQCNIKYFWIPDSVDSVGEYAFGYDDDFGTPITLFCESIRAKDEWMNYWCPRSSDVYYGSSKSVFSLWSGLDPEARSIELPKDTDFIPSYAFKSFNKLESIVIPDTVTRIGRGAFSGCERLKAVSLPEGITEVPDNAFDGCLRLESVVIPNTVTRIGSESFRYCISLSDIKIPSNVNIIEYYAFENCTALKETTVPEGVVNIDNGVFSRCYSLKQVTLPSSLQVIGDYAFGGCRSLTSITIPEGVSFVDSGCFGDCNNLKFVEILGDAEIGSRIFLECKGQIKLFLNPSATMYIHEAIDNTNVDIYTSASSFPDNWGVDSSAHYGKIVYNTSLESFRELMKTSTDNPSGSGDNGQNSGSNDNSGNTGGGLTGGGGSAGGGGGAGGGGSSDPVESEDKTITNSGSGDSTATNVDASDSTIVIEDKAITKIEADKGEMIVANAVENKVSEVMINAETKKGNAASSTVALPASTVKNLVDKTDASLRLVTDSAEVSLDKEAVAAVAAQAGTTGDVKLVVETKENSNEQLVVELKIETPKGTVGDFQGGKVTVSVPVNDSLAKKTLVCVFIDENGKYTKMGGKLSSDGKTFIFTTSHFSTYAILEEAEADAIIAEQNKPAEEAKPVKVGNSTVKLYTYTGGKLRVKASAKNANGYKVYYKKSTWKKYKTYTKGNVKSLDKTFKKLSKGKYTVKVKAYNKGADGKVTQGAASGAKKITVRY